MKIDCWCWLNIWTVKSRAIPPVWRQNKQREGRKGSWSCREGDQEEQSCLSPLSHLSEKPNFKTIVGWELVGSTWKKPFEDDLVAAVSLEDGEVLSVRLEAAELAWFQRWIKYPDYTHCHSSISFNTIIWWPYLWLLPECFAWRSLLMGLI